MSSFFWIIQVYIVHLLVNWFLNKWLFYFNLINYYKLLELV